ncbi:hypothetical protein [Pseudomonas alabamensis]|uniref:hypothetical protein n=1 Tax=Pseudomonas alabamensis TaxID=3064349 RepID=UPI003F65080E
MVDAMDSSSQEAHIIFEDDFIVVARQPGTSDFILVAFGDLANLANGSSVYAGVPAKKLGITTIGFMAKKPNWFPKESVTEAISSIKKYFFGCPEIVTYGGSMGGYAAIKYSRALGAKTVAAFCPQWTIDKAECSGRNPGYQEHFTASMSGMGIKPEDTSGSIYIFYDPDHESDRYHANTISSKAVNVRHIPVRSVGHHVTSVLAGTDNMGEILSMARKEDHLGLCRLVNRIRKKHQTTASFLVPKIAKRHPRILKKIIFKDVIDKKSDQYGSIRLKTDALRLFVDQMPDEFVLDAVESIQKNTLCPVRSAMLDSYRAKLKDKIAAESKSIVTAHGSIIAYSSIQGGLVHKPKSEVLSTAHLYPVVSYEYQGHVAFGVNFGDRDYLCQLTSKGDIRLADIFGTEVEHRTLISCIPVGSKSFQAKCRGFFVCAERGGNIAFNRKVAKEWETFVIESR